MSYTALYRKYRPGEFDDVKGQDHIVTTLKNQIKGDRVGHAYLFCGTRGTGKTTVAKIFAKAVNCENPVDGGPCGECPTCKAIAAGNSTNVVEIDAASNNSVEDVRRIREEVSYSPTQGKYRVYIIDEVHMLSTSAFNALLKTLEEPPSYVIFILATTEANKIPITILSRCQRYDFRRISVDTIASRLNEMLAAEGVTAEESAVRYVARAGDGSLRDAISLLDRCIAFYLGQELTYEHVLDVLGAADVEVYGRLLEAISNSRVVDAIGILDELVEKGRELGQFINDFIWHLRNLLLVKCSDDMEDILNMSGENVAILKEEARMVSAEVLMRYIRILSELSGQLRFATQKRIIIEIALIKLCNPAMERSDDSIIDRIEHIEKRLESGQLVVASQGDSHQKAVKEPAKAAAKREIIASALPEDIQKVAGQWKSVISDSGIGAHFMKGTYPSVSSDNKLIVVFDDEMKYNMMTGKKKELEKVVADYAGGTVEVVLRLADGVNVTTDELPDLTTIIDMPIEIED